MFEELPEGVEDPEQPVAYPTGSLVLERDTLNVHHVNAVTYKTEDFFVSRFSFLPGSCEF